MGQPSWWVDWGGVEVEVDEAWWGSVVGDGVGRGGR